jgi:hypothetical protein
MLGLAKSWRAGGREAIVEGEEGCGIDFGTRFDVGVGSREVIRKGAPGGADSDDSSPSASTSTSMSCTRMTFRPRVGLGERDASALLLSASISIVMSFTGVGMSAVDGLGAQYVLVAVIGRGPRLFGEDHAAVDV